MALKTALKGFFLVFLLFCANHSVAQQSVRKFIPLVSENVKIDSLLDYVISHSKSKTKFYSAIVTDLGYLYTLAFVQINLKGSRVQYPLPGPEFLEDVSYFRYKGNIVFVRKQGKNVFSFFEKTSKKKRFDFSIELLPLGYQAQHNFFMETFEYKGGIFKPFEWPTRDKPEPDTTKAP